MFCGPNLVFEANNFSSRSLCAAGSIVLLFAGADRNIIKLINRWRSDYILCYLHIQEETIMRNLSQLILTNGNYSFLTQKEAPCF